jgi:hypothetical protein
MRLRAHRPILADFQIEQKLVGVKLLAEAAERRPLQVVRGRCSDISVEDEFSILFGDMQLVLVRIEDFDSVLRAFGSLSQASLTRCTLQAMSSRSIR